MRYDLAKGRPDYTQEQMEAMYPDTYFFGTYSCKGYVSKKLEMKDYPAEPYTGRHGVGYVVYSPSYNSTQYCHITYYIVKE